MSEKTVSCPFNSQHVMLESSLQRHIIRCMVNYPEHVVCPYNALHRFKNKVLLMNHMLICPSKSTIGAILDWNLEKLIDNADTQYHLENTRNFNLAYEDWDAELESSEEQRRTVSNSK
ncbi:hypothetical protein WA026_001488 [Henosepilachna vigintioctopunctata]|uniref:CHHC U11-48K-type domain-containing protein n=1 Tax=Henosepilachna vigintioctopunctata TaxID=420089 RepID=A0AAW1URZ8_9CUCU